MSSQLNHIFLAVILSLSALPVYEATIYYYYYYNQAPRVSSPNCPTYYTYNYPTTCHIDTCYTSQTWDQCCLHFFTYNGLPYKLCRCNQGTVCAGTPLTAAPTPSTTITTTTPTPTPTTSTTPTPTTSTTPTPTTSTTPTPTTSTTPTPTTSTTVMPRAVTTPTTTTQAPTTTTTTAAPTTAKSLCSSTFRLLNGDVVNECDFAGVANITRNNGTILTCNAVYTPATAAGVKKLTFVTSTFCANVIAGSRNTVFDIQIGTETYPIMSPFFTVVNGTNGASFLEMNSRYANNLASLGCQRPACAFDRSSEMAGKLDYNNCKMVSWGSTNASTLRDNKLMEAKLELMPFGCADKIYGDILSVAMCFKTVTNSNLLCAGDSGAPVYCNSPSTGEWILLGVAGRGDCNRNEYVGVLNIP